jgi:hypothetical protein
MGTTRQKLDISLVGVSQSDVINTSINLNLRFLLAALRLSAE